MKRALNTVFTVILVLFATALFSISSIHAYAEDQHSYDENQVEYQWNYDHSACKAVFTCTSCGETVIKDTLVTIDAYILPTETENGTARYTATVSLEGKTYVHEFYQADIPATGKKKETVATPAETVTTPVDTTVTDASIETFSHNYVATGFTWNYDHSACTVTLFCNHCNSTVQKSCLVTMDVYTWPTKDTNGVTEYVATASLEGKTYQEILRQRDIPNTERILALAEKAEVNHEFDESKTNERGQIIVNMQDGKEVQLSEGAASEDKTETPVDDKKDETSSDETVDSSDDEKEEVEETSDETSEDAESESEDETETEESESVDTEESESDESETTLEETETEVEVTVENTTPVETESAESETEIETTAAIEPETKNSGIPVWAIIVIGVLVLIIAILVILLMVVKRQQEERRKKHDEMKKKINDELK